MMWDKNALIATGILAVTASLSGCGVGEASTLDAQTRESSIPVPVEVTFPTRADIFATYDATASIESDFDAPAMARVAGEVVELLVEEGDAVSAGQVLARLDGERLRLTMLSAKANLEKAQREYERYQDLHERGLVSASMYDGLRYELEALKATYDLAALDYDYSNLRAPIDGVVASRDIKLGQNLSAGASAFRITNTTQLKAELRIPQSELPKFSAGHTATLAVDSMPEQRFVARIERISPTIDTRNGTFRATAVIDNTRGDLAPGMFARFSIAYEKHEDALLIPARAIVNEDEISTVYVLANDAVEQRTVVVGVQSGDNVEIVDGLDAGDQIVVVGQSSIRDGSKVLAQSRSDEGRFSG
ncbi:MAG: efflux RND transporter periplasmic adaptor subunit [Pseudomonadota bacterium]